MLHMFQHFRDEILLGYHSGGKNCNLKVFGFAMWPQGLTGKHVQSLGKSYFLPGKWNQNYPMWYHCSSD